MNRIQLAGAALAVVFAASAMSQPTPGSTTGRSTPPKTFEQQMQTHAAESNRRMAEQEAAAQAMLERDIKVGNMTPAQQEQFKEYARERVNQAINNTNMEGLSRDLKRDVERFTENAAPQVDRFSALDPARSENMSDREFGQTGAAGVVNIGGSALQLNRDVLRTARPLIEEFGQASADIMRERERIINSNPNVSADERQTVRRQTSQVERGVQALPTRLDEADFRTRSEEQRLRESEQRIAEQMERMAQEQGRDPTQWTPPSGSSTPVAPRPPGRVFPVPQRTTPPPPPAPQAAAPPAGPAPSASRPTGSSGTRGTIPGQGGDPYEGLRVPASQGGTGVETAQSRAAAQARTQQQQRAEQQAQAERNASRTERNRQAAMDRARRDNEALEQGDASSRAAAATSEVVRQQEEYNDILEQLRRTMRPGQVGGGGGSTGGGSYAGQMAGGDGFPDGIPSIVEWMGNDPSRASANGSFGSADAFGAASEPAGSAADMAAAMAELDAWQSFELGGTLIVAELVSIYDGYDLDNAPPGSSGRSLSAAGSSLSAAGTSLSAAGNSLSLAGSITPSSAPTGMLVNWGGFNLSADPFRVSNGSRPEPGSYADMLAQINGPRPSLLNTNPWTDRPLATNHRDLAAALYGPLWSDQPFRIQADPYRRYGRAMSDIEVASLFDTELDTQLRMFGDDYAWLRAFTANDQRGLGLLLAQPFNVLLTWGAGAFDLDLHMTGPLTGTTADRFHIYFAAQGSLTTAPFAELITDCVCNSGSEVVLTSALTQGGVYRVSVFNFGNQSASSTNLADASQATLQIVRGGTAVSEGNGTTIVGGRTLVTVTAPAGQPGNTWVAAEIDPANGHISAPGVIVQSGDSDVVH